jgi:hypothetical protein
LNRQPDDAIHSVSRKKTQQACSGAQKTTAVKAATTSRTLWLHQLMQISDEADRARMGARDFARQARGLNLSRAPFIYSANKWNLVWSAARISIRLESFLHACGMNRHAHLSPLEAASNEEVP